MSLNAISLDSLRSIPTGQKVALLGLLVALWRKRRRHALAMLRKGSAA